MLKPISEIWASLRVNPDNTFSNFQDVPGGIEAKRSVQAVIDGKRPMVMITGGVGNGKTHLLHAASIELYKRGQFARVCLFADILSTLRESIGNPEMNYDEILNNYCYCERLIIDDIGAGGSATDFGYKILEAIVCARYGRELLTIMSTNLDIEDKDFPERVRSRVKDKSVCYLVLNKAVDYRPRKGKNGLSNR